MNDHMDCLFQALVEKRIDLPTVIRHALKRGLKIGFLTGILTGISLCALIAFLCYLWK